MKNKILDNFSAKNEEKKTILSKKERLILYGAFFIFITSLISWSIHFYFSSTKVVPTQGGEYIEGFVGKPLYINPVISSPLSQTNEIDIAISSLIFSSLLSYDENGNLVNDLAKNYSLSEDGKTYSFEIIENAKWQDGKSLSANDVAFTFNLIKNPAYKSSLRGNLKNVNIEVEDKNKIKFILEEPYTPFLNVLTFGVLPQHLFEEISPDNFLLSDLNLKPIGSGPYAFSSLKTNENGDVISYELIANDQHHDKKPFIEKISFNFYQNEDELIEAYSKKEISAFGLSSYEKIASFEEKKDSQINQIVIPRYFGIFFNQTKSIPLSDNKVREALNCFADKDKIIEEVFFGYADKSRSPILNDFGKFQSAVEEKKCSSEDAKKILDEAGWKIDENSENQIRKKGENDLKIKIITTLWPGLEKTAEVIKNQWREIGVEVEIEKYSLTDLQQNFIRPREYQGVLFGQEYFGNDPDAHKSWHSSNKKDPGNNIALFEDSEIDKLLEEVRISNNLEERIEKYKTFERNLIEKNPAVFLFSPRYIFISNKKIKGIEIKSAVNQSLHLGQIEDWHIKTKREKK